jgi:threonine dehydrogenase-like Zn-dependent dehydrogenase
VPGVYGSFIDKFPFGSYFSKGLRMATGQTHVHRYLSRLLERIQRAEIDPSFVITHRMALEDAPEGYRKFRDKQDNCIKIVLDPWAERKAA